MKRNMIVLIVVVVAILAAIFVLEGQRVPLEDVQAEEIIVENTQQEPVTATDQERIDAKAEQYNRAVELVEPGRYINSEPFLIQDYIGEKVILVDFWTYSCINCQRTMPYLGSWWKEYEDDGLLIIGVHTPEFAFEKEYDNVVQATEQFGVTWPVVQDNDKKTFRAYNNRYWPRKYLIDIDGFIVYDHIGEGAYDETEAKIVELLNERAEVLGLDSEVAVAGTDETELPDFARINTPEIYFGTFRSPYLLGNQGAIIPGSEKEFTLPDERVKNLFYFEGTWKIEDEYSALTSEQGAIEIQYEAKNVNIVAGSTESAVITVYVDGEQHNQVTVTDETLYELVEMDGYGVHDLRLEIDGQLDAYTFTFG